MSSETKKKTKNVILVDFDVPCKWNFYEGLCETSQLNWEIKKCINNKNRIGKFSNLIRYIDYFSFSLYIFIRRKQYSNVIAWQQFYGLIFAFFASYFE